MQGTHDNDDPQTEAVAKEIAQYLRRRSYSADTLTGIAQWWVTQQRIWEENKKVEQAMEYLCAQGLVEKRELQGGEVLYKVVLDTGHSDEC